MPEARLRIADEFIYDLADISSSRVLGDIRQAVQLIATMPEIGSANVRDSLKAVFGEGIRKFPVSTFVIVYRYRDGVVDILACVYGPRIK